MSPTGGCATSERDLLNWPKAELQRCVYTVTDTLKNGTKRTKKAIVYLANPTAAQVLAWLRSACAIAQPAAVDACVRKQAKAIRGASGAQFPVAGLVWEDLSGDKIQEAYIFRNGVTVRISGLANGSTDPVATDAALEALASAQTVTGVKATGGYARILSTARDAFRDHTGRTDIPVGKSDAASALAWSDVVGSTYRAALSVPSNPLVTAAVCSAYGFPTACKPK